ncbi:MAG: hypothetical protein ABJG42_24680 [Vibrio splendidus]
MKDGRYEYRDNSSRIVIEVRGENIECIETSGDSGWTIGDTGEVRDLDEHKWCLTSSGEVEQLREQLAKANERVKELEKGNKSCAVAIREIIAKGDIGPLLVTGDELDEIVNKFAIEQKIEAFEKYAFMCEAFRTVPSIEGLRHHAEQLRKEQE